jgi:tetratricopeptide (TPR) repeat protein
VAIDRDTRLRNAENLLRQGKLEQAIAEYRRLFDSQPTDRTTANVLADLYLRAGQKDRAVEIYARVADVLGREGFWSKAAAIYKKILKIRPQDEYVLLQLAEMAINQQLIVDARAYLSEVREQRFSRGDRAGAAAITIRMGALDPMDYNARLARARAQAEVGEVSEAVAGLRQIATELTEQGRLDEAAAVVKQARLLAPSDAQVKPAEATPKPAPTDPISQEAPSVAGEDTEPAATLLHPVSNASAPKDLDEVFADLREDAQRDATNDSALELAAGMAFFQAGQPDFALPRLEAASRAPAQRFEAAATLGRLFLERGETSRAIDWFERAAEAQAPTPVQSHRLHYELADALERAGEAAKALAIFRELQAKAGDYQDVASRVDRLVKVQTRG